MVCERKTFACIWYMKKFYNFLALLFQMASKLPRPQLRGLFGDYIRKRMAAIFSVSLVSTLPVYYYGVNQIKHKHLDFFRQVLDILFYTCVIFGMHIPERDFSLNIHFRCTDVPLICINQCYFHFLLYIIKDENLELLTP